MEYVFLFGHRDEDGELIPTVKVTFHSEWEEADPNCIIKADPPIEMLFNLWVEGRVSHYGYFIDPKRMSPVELWGVASSPDNPSPFGELEVIGEIPEKYLNADDEDE